MSSRFDLNNVARNVSHQTVILTSIVALLASAMDTWKKHCYLKFSINLNEFVGLDKIVEENILPFRQCLLIAKRSIRCLYGLHARDMVQKDFTIKDLRIRRLRRVIVNTITIFTLFYFQHLSESRFLRGGLLGRSKFENFYHD